MLDTSSWYLLYDKPKKRVGNVDYCSLDFIVPLNLTLTASLIWKRQYIHTVCHTQEPFWLLFIFEGFKTEVKHHKVYYLDIAQLNKKISICCDAWDTSGKCTGKSCSDWTINTQSENT